MKYIKSFNKKLILIIIFIIGLIIALYVLAGTRIRNNRNSVWIRPTPEPTESLIGGGCSYDEFKGYCTIASIAKTEESIAQSKTIGGPGYEGFEIRFKFKPTDSLDSIDWERLAGYGITEGQISNKEYLLQLSNSWYPGPKFLEKYNILENSVFNCSVSIEHEGTCTPVIFGFDNIDTTDFFESNLTP